MIDAESRQPRGAEMTGTRCTGHRRAPFHRHHLLATRSMVLGLLSLSYISALLLYTCAAPVEHRPEVRFTAKSERAWLWGWAWGTESTVSIVDRSPVVSFPSRPGTLCKKKYTLYSPIVNCSLTCSGIRG